MTVKYEKKRSDECPGGEIWGDYSGYDFASCVAIKDKFLLACQNFAGDMTRKSEKILGHGRRHLTDGY